MTQDTDTIQMIQPGTIDLGCKIIDEEKIQRSVEAECNKTEPMFYEFWSREHMIKELCRLNQVLIDMQKIIQKILRR